MTDIENELHIIRAGLACAPATSTNKAAYGAIERLTAMLEADAKALADVRALDKWRNTYGRSVRSFRDTNGRDLCVLQVWSVTSEPADHDFTGGNPDETRAEAAAWVRGGQ